MPRQTFFKLEKESRPSLTVYGKNKESIGRAKKCGWDQPVFRKSGTHSSKKNQQFKRSGEEKSAVVDAKICCCEQQESGASPSIVASVTHGLFAMVTKWEDRSIFFCEQYAHPFQEAKSSRRKSRFQQSIFQNFCGEFVWSVAAPKCSPRAKFVHFDQLDKKVRNYTPNKILISPRRHQSTRAARRLTDARHIATENHIATPFYPQSCS